MHGAGLRDREQIDSAEVRKRGDDVLAGQRLEYGPMSSPSWCGGTRQ